MPCGRREERVRGSSDTDNDLPTLPTLLCCTCESRKLEGGLDLRCKDTEHQGRVSPPVSFPHMLPPLQHHCRVPRDRWQSGGSEQRATEHALGRARHSTSLPTGREGKTPQINGDSKDITGPPRKCLEAALEARRGVGGRKGG